MPKRNHTEYTEERWLPIKGHETYLVSSFGRVKNTRTGKFIGNPRKGCYGAAVIDGEKWQLHQLFVGIITAGTLKINLDK